MSERITRKFLATRLATTTGLMVGAGVIPPFARYGFEQSGSDDKPWQLVMDEINPDNSRSRTNITGAITWAQLCTAVDALYETGWIATRMCEARQGNS